MSSSSDISMPGYRSIRQKRNSRRVIKPSRSTTEASRATLRHRRRVWRTSSSPYDPWREEIVWNIAAEFWKDSMMKNWSTYPRIRRKWSYLFECSRMSVESVEGGVVLIRQRTVPRLTSNSQQLPNSVSYQTVQNRI